MEPYYEIKQPLLIKISDNNLSIILNVIHVLRSMPSVIKIFTNMNDSNVINDKFISLLYELILSDVDNNLENALNELNKYMIDKYNTYNNFYDIFNIILAEFFEKEIKIYELFLTVVRNRDKCLNSNHIINSELVYQNCIIFDINTQYDLLYNFAVSFNLSDYNLETTVKSNFKKSRRSDDYIDLADNATLEKDKIQQKIDDLFGSYSCSEEIANEKIFSISSYVKQHIKIKNNSERGKNAYTNTCPTCVNNGLFKIDQFLINYTSTSLKKIGNILWVNIAKIDSNLKNKCYSDIFPYYLTIKSTDKNKFLLYKLYVQILDQDINNAASVILHNKKFYYINKDKIIDLDNFPNTDTTDLFYHFMGEYEISYIKQYMENNPKYPSFQSYKILYGPSENTNNRKHK